jgi:DNA ligase (NAD+)
MCQPLFMFERMIIYWMICWSCWAAPEPVERHAAQLRVVLRQADAAYYNSGEPIMGDAAYDALRSQYEKLLTEYPDLPVLSSVGAAVPEGRERAAHTKPVLSLKKAYSDDEVLAFVKRCGMEETYCIEPKLDGLTVVLRYQNGLLVQALTRGDGKQGSDVTTALMASGCVPTRLANAPGSIELRGEMLMSFSAFEALNERRAQEGLSALKSPRNSAAGSLRLKDLGEIVRRGLQVRIFEVIDIEPEPLTHTAALARVSALGLPAVESRTVSGSDVLPVLTEMNLRRDDSIFTTDGMVIKLDDCAEFERLGATAKYPRGAIARKYRAVPVETTLLRIEWTEGDTGRITPVAHFEPIEVGGATLQRASLHSLDHLRALDLMLGDRIEVVRAGGSVPEIIGRSPRPRTGQEKPIRDPE